MKLITLEVFYRNGVVVNFHNLDVPHNETSEETIRRLLHGGDWLVLRGGDGAYGVNMSNVLHIRVSDEPSEAQS